MLQHVRHQLHQRLHAQCIQLAKNKHWNNIILVSIILNCLLMAFLYDPLDVRKHKVWRDRLDIFFTFLFMFEMFVKIIAQGLFFAPNAYLKDGWNVLDFLIVATSFLALLATYVPALSSLESLKALRVLVRSARTQTLPARSSPSLVAADSARRVPVAWQRPLRLISRNPGMKLISRPPRTELATWAADANRPL